MKRGLIITLSVVAFFVIGMLVYVGNVRDIAKNVAEIRTGKALVGMPDTASWETYENNDFGFSFKFPREYIMKWTFPGRLAAGKNVHDPVSDPQIYDLSPKNVDLAKNLPEVSLYVAPPGFFSCPPLDSSNDGTGYIDAPAQPITISGVSGLTRSGRVFGAVTPAASYAREVYVCNDKGYFRFSTPLLSSEVFAGVLSSFRFSK